jgi:hypothetical protein
MRMCRRSIMVCLALAGVLYALPAAASASLLRTVKFTHPGACQSTVTSKGAWTYNLATGMSQTGIAFDAGGHRLFVSCWGDNTIDQVDLASGAETVYHVSGGTGFGALTYRDGALWACNQHDDEVGQISLDPFMFTGTYTRVFTATGSACVDALAFDPLDATGDTLWMGTDTGTTPKVTGKTLDAFVNQAGAWAEAASLSVASSIGHRSGIVATPNTFVLAQPSGGSGSTFQLFESSNRALDGTTTFTQLASWSGSRLRPEDLECDPTTFSGKTAVWVIFAKKDMARAYQIQDACG